MVSRLTQGGVQLTSQQHSYTGADKATPEQSFSEYLLMKEAVSVFEEKYVPTTA